MLADKKIELLLPEGEKHLELLAPSVAEVFLRLLGAFEVSVRSSLESFDVKERVAAQQLMLQLIDRMLRHKEFRIQVAQALQEARTESSGLSAADVVKAFMQGVNCAK